MGLTIGTLYVRRSNHIQASPDRVWQEFTTTERIKNWFSLGHRIHEFEPRLGGTVEMSVDIDGEERGYGGQVLVFDPERELSFETEWHAPHAAGVSTFWTIRLSALYGGTHAEMFHHGFERFGADAADNIQGYEQGWDLKHLTALRAIVDGA